METHLWHAKRMKMKNYFGYKIPYHNNDKSKRACYRQFNIYLDLLKMTVLCMTCHTMEQYY